jgi:hypothetical protein
MRPALAVTMAMLFATSAFAQTAAAPEHSRPITVTRATRTQGALRIDGVLDEAEWGRAAPCESFTQIDPQEGQPASQPTIVRVLYDDDALYIGARLRDRGKTIGRLGRRDMDAGDSDWFKVLVDSYHDHRTAFGFEVNPAGVRRDEVRTIDTDDNSWDPVWEAATRVDSGGWTAEIRIPLTQLRFSGAREQTWGIQFERIIGRRTGTGGSAGVDYLDATALRYRIFRDLWAIRTLQIRRVAAPALKHAAFYDFRNA